MVSRNGDLAHQDLFRFVVCRDFQYGHVAGAATKIKDDALDGPACLYDTFGALTHDVVDERRCGFIEEIIILKINTRITTGEERVPTLIELEGGRHRDTKMSRLALPFLKPGVL